MQRHAGPVAGRPKLSQAVCFAGTPAPALASQRREKLPCNPGGEAQKRPVGCNGPYNPPSMALPCCPPFAQGGLRRAAAGKTLFAWMDTTGLARERSMGAASRRQSLSRRSPTAPFAQGSHLCLGKYNRLSAGAQYGCSVTLPRLGCEKGRGSGGRTAILSLPFFIQPAWRGSAVRLPRHWAQNNTPPKLQKTPGGFLQGFLCSHVRRSEHSGSISRKYRAAEPGDGHA